MPTQKLIIIGAGPKAMAIASKSCVLAELGFSVPEIHIVEKRGVGANWTGDSGYTNGRLALGTSPEKDVGFPYRSECWGESLNAKIDRRMKDYSWQSFLIGTGDYSEWVDRGRPAPQHRDWAAYLKWVWAACSKRVHCHRGDVASVAIDGEQWEVRYRKPEARTSEAGPPSPPAPCDGDTASLCGDGLVITGPGKMRLARPLPVHDGVLTVESFWKHHESFRNRPPTRIALVGTGESAAAIAIALTQNGNEQLAIDIVSPVGMAYSRGESFQENRVYSSADNGNWSRLSAEDRRGFIRRTDRGVFSMYAQSLLNSARNLRVIPGRLVEVAPRPQNQLQLTLEYSGTATDELYDFVIVATGADQLAMLRELMDETTSAAVLQRSGLAMMSQEIVEKRINRSLGIEGLSPQLHLPMLSGLAQGPGFANLSCLGRLSDRILSSYVRVP